MSRPQYHYASGQELPAIQINWAQRDTDGGTSALALSTSYSSPTVVVKLRDTGDVLLTKSASITLADTYPNLVISWTAADMTTIRAAIVTALTAVSDNGDVCSLTITARRTADSLDAVFSPKDLPTIEILP
jgi:hypothetical protein